MTTSKVHYSSKSNEWATPDQLWNRLDNIYRFDLDVAATKDNARCANYFTPSDDGLMQSWADKRVWCNPPYGKAIASWVNKATLEAKRAAFIVMLVPARTDTVWWHVAIKSARVEFLQGRLKFKGAASSAPFPSALLYWNC